MGMSVRERLAPSAVVAMRAAIAEVAGNEVFFLGALDAAGCVEAVRVLARGHRHAVPALLQIPRPGEVILHNHPSGDPSPSAQDVQMTKQLREAARIIDIDLVDHLIVGTDEDDPLKVGHYSFREAGIL